MRNPIIHGHALKGKLTRTYKAWAAMIQRCTNSSCAQYCDYGGREISISPELLKFKSFLSHMGECPLGLFLDRIDNNGNYEVGNVRWATRIEQNRNQRSNKFITYLGKTQCVAAWEEELGFPRSTIYNRLITGWSINEALSTKPNRHKDSKPN